MGCINMGFGSAKNSYLLGKPNIILDDFFGQIPEKRTKMEVKDSNRLFKTRKARTLKKREKRDPNKARQEENYMARQTLFPNMDSRLWLIQIRNVGIVNLRGKKEKHTK